MKLHQAHIKYEDKYIKNTNRTTFLGLILDNTLFWQPHLDKLSSKLSSASYIIRTLKPILTIKNLKVIYYSYVHSIISYGIIVWGNSSYNNIIFKLQKQIIRIITNSNNRTSCHDLFKELNILPLQSQYILSLATFVVGNFEEFSTNSDIHSFKISWTVAVTINNLTTKRMWKLLVLTLLHATWHTDSLNVVLPSISASHYHNCCIDGSTRPEYFGYTLIYTRQHSLFTVQWIAVLWESTPYLGNNTLSKQEKNWKHII
jgi:hypothetical protein